MLEVKNLEKSFKKKKALNGVSYSFEPGIYGLLGSNGAGKTTFIRCICGIYNTGSSCVMYNGKSALNGKEYLGNLGYLPQKFGMYKQLKVYEMLELLANLKGVTKKEATPMIDSALERVNLTERKNSRVSTLSGGMIRRLGIAQALMTDPEILLFDEPTAGLDPEERLRFKSIISEIGEDKTVIISTHIVEDVESLCDKIIVINEGSFVMSGTLKDIEAIAEGKVFEVPLSAEKELCGSYFTVKREEHGGEKSLRVLSSEPIAFGHALEPTIEDGYLCLLKNL